MKTNMLNQHDKQGRRNGYWETYWSSSNYSLSCKGYYKHGKKRGLWEYYFSDGQMWKKGEHKSGKKLGLWYEYEYTK